MNGCCPAPGSASDRVTAGTLPPTPQSLDGAPAPLSAPSTGAQAGAYASFAPGPGVTVEIGVSYVSVAGARANLAAEAAGRSFPALQARATQTWRGWLDRVRVTGGSHREQRLFASQLYHALLMPNTVSDVTGRYPGMDGRVHRTRTTEYANFSGWDIYRSQFPLLAMLAPRRASAMAASLLDEGAQSSGQLPKWSQLSTQNDIMVGDPADLMLSDAWAFGARGFPARAALAAMVHGASVPGQARTTRTSSAPAWPTICVWATSRPRTMSTSPPRPTCTPRSGARSRRRSNTHSPTSGSPGSRTASVPDRSAVASPCGEPTGAGCSTRRPDTSGCARATAPGWHRSRR